MTGEMRRKDRLLRRKNVRMVLLAMTEGQRSDGRGTIWLKRTINVVHSPQTTDHGLVWGTFITVMRHGSCVVGLFESKHILCDVRTDCFVAINVRTVLLAMTGGVAF
jgi:hypothetical protein